MSLLADRIEQLILQKMLEEEKIILRRNELADELDCAPSQISYVLSTRFSNDKGFNVQSRRGLGGFISITRVNPQNGNIETRVATIPVSHQLSVGQSIQSQREMHNKPRFEPGVPTNIQEVDRWIGVLLYKELINNTEARFLHDAFAAMFDNFPMQSVANAVNQFYKDVLDELRGE